MYNEQQLTTLTKNLENTKWTNLRLENGQLVADFNGDMNFPVGGGRYQPYKGVTSCRIFDVSKDVIEKEFDYKFDQSGFMWQKFDYQPLNDNQKF